jgi:hypothetical protein
VSTYDREEIEALARELEQRRYDVLDVRYLSGSPTWPADYETRMAVISEFIGAYVEGFFVGLPLGLVPLEGDRRFPA